MVNKLNVLQQVKLLAFSNVKPFHDDPILQNHILGLIRDYRVREFIETGTFRADSILWLAKLRPELRIRSCEKSRMFYLYSNKKIELTRNIWIYNEDSRIFLKECIPKDENIRMFWLDAHWDKDFPLLEELSIIFERQKSGLILIDDFQVPDPSSQLGCLPNFGYDTYDGKPINLELIKNILPSNTRIEFPDYKKLTRGYVTIYYGLR